MILIAGVVLASPASVATDEPTVVAACPGLCHSEGTIGLLFGSSNCAFTPAARLTVAAVTTSGLQPQIDYCYIDMDSGAGRDVATQFNVRSSPVLIFLVDGAEQWRCIAPGTADKLLLVAAEVARGERTWDARKLRLYENTLDAEELLDLAASAEEASETQVVRDARERIASGTVDATHGQRVEASRMLAQSETDARRLTAIETHLRLFPEDTVGRVVLVREFLRAGAPSQDVATEIDRIVEEVSSRREEFAPPFLASVYTLAYQLATEQDRTRACWAFPIVRQALLVVPKDGWHIEHLAALSRLCPGLRVADIVEAFYGAYSAEAMPAEKRERFDLFVQGLLNSGYATGDALLGRGLETGANTGGQGNDCGSP